jgi:RNA polymerase sigma factor (sigma-70 family)
MNLDTLYKKACDNCKLSENELFGILTARFRYLARQRVWNRYDCEEVVQNALMAIAENYRSVRLTVGFAAWAHTILSNKVADYFRAREHHRRAFAPLPEHETSGPGSEPDRAMRRKLLDCLKKVNAANRRHARMLVLKYQGHDFENICRRLNMTRNNAYSVLSRARTMLERCLDTGEIE